MSQREIPKTIKDGTDNHLTSERLFSDSQISDTRTNSFSKLDRTSLTELLKHNEEQMSACFAAAAVKAKALPTDVLAAQLAAQKDNPFQSKAQTDKALELFNKQLANV